MTITNSGIPDDVKLVSKNLLLIQSADNFFIFTSLEQFNCRYSRGDCFQKCIP